MWGMVRAIVNAVVEVVVEQLPALVLRGAEGCGIEVMRRIARLR
jgi:hypothetical protein